MKNLILAAGILALPLIACQEVRDTSYGTLARGVDEACERGMDALAMEARKRAVNEINARTAVGNWTPSDCDSDGTPDFEINPDGSVVVTP